MSQETSPWRSLIPAGRVGRGVRYLTPRPVPDRRTSSTSASLGDNIKGMSSFCQVTEDTKAMGTYLRRLRDQAGLSQRDLARRLGCQQPAISRLEAGEVRPNIATLQRIAEALGLQLELRMVDLDEALTSGVPVAFS